MKAMEEHGLEGTVEVTEACPDDTDAKAAWSKEKEKRSKPKKEKSHD